MASSLNWTTPFPEVQGLDSGRLESAWQVLAKRGSNTFVGARRSELVFERYADDWISFSSNTTRAPRTCSLYKWNARAHPSRCQRPRSGGRARRGSGASAFPPRHAALSQTRRQSHQLVNRGEAAAHSALTQVSDDAVQRDPGRHWRAGVGCTIDLNIPRRVASTQSPTPFLQALLAWEYPINTPRIHRIHRRAEPRFLERWRRRTDWCARAESPRRTLP